MENKKKNTTKNSKKKISKNNRKSKSDIQAIGYIAIGLLLTIAIYTDTIGFLSAISKGLLYPLLGIASYIIPLYIVYYGFNIIVSKSEIKYTRRIFGVTVVSIVLTLLCGTIFLQSVEVTTLGETLKAMNLSNSTSIHGGAISFLITFPLVKLLGFIGTYIIYISLLCISSILIFDITLYDVYIKIKNMIYNFKKNMRETPPKKSHNKTSNKGVNRERIIDIQVEPKEHKERDIYIKNINNKIQISDFMKNSELKEETTSDIEEEVSVASNPIENLDFQETIKPTKKMTAETKEIVNKEIAETINESTLDTKVYNFPNLDLLTINTKSKLKSSDKKELLENAQKLEEILGNFGVQAKVLKVTKGPSVTRFELQPSPGVKVSKIVNLQDDIALGLAANGVRMEAPIPGKSAIGIEVPNQKQTPVLLREVLDSKEFLNCNKKLAFSLGKDITGNSIIGDLSRMPHMLIAGATGSGKSVCINTLIISLLYKYSPSDVKLLMVDPKVVELSVYNGIPHLLIPVVTDPKKAAGALNWAVNEMNRRYNLFSEMKSKNIESYNSLYEKGTIEEKLPYIVIIVDELADLMMTCPNDVEDYICRLAQKARAAGMHLIIATQRPSVDVITGVIKANIPSRISFAVSSGIDSRTILDQSGAEKLLGRGDMLYYPIGENKPLRVQGAFISEEEVENVVEYIKSDDIVVEYENSIIDHINSKASEESSNGSEQNDELLDEAIETVIEYQQASTSFLQRKLRVGFNRASRIMEELEEKGIISGKDGSKPRQVLVSKENMYNNE